MEEGGGRIIFLMWILSELALTSESTLKQSCIVSLESNCGFLPDLHRYIGLINFGELDHIFKVTEGLRVLNFTH